MVSTYHGVVKTALAHAIAENLDVEGPLQNRFGIIFRSEVDFITYSSHRYAGKMFRSCEVMKMQCMQMMSWDLIGGDTEPKDKFVPSVAPIHEVESKLDSKLDPRSTDASMHDTLHNIMHEIEQHESLHSTAMVGSNEKGGRSHFAQVQVSLRPFANSKYWVFLQNCRLYKEGFSWL